MIDASIYGNIGRGVKSVADYDNERMQGQQNKLTLMMNQNQMQDAQRSREGENALARLLAGGGDVAQGLAREGFGKQSMAYTDQQQKMAKDKAAMEKDQLANTMQKLALGAQILSGVTDQASYDQARATAQANGLDVSRMQPNYDPAFVAQKLQEGQNEGERLARLKLHKEYTEPTANTVANNVQSGLNNTATNDRTVSEGALNRGVQVRGQNMTDARSRDRQILEQGVATAEAGGPNQAAFTKQFGKAESGFRWKPDGSSEAIPGGSKDIKAGELGVKAEKRAESALEGAKNVRREISDATKLIGQHSAGFGGWASIIPTSDARNLQAKLTSIKANIGFDRLQQMRDQSPTGGALGQVAVQELVALQSTIASLDQMQSPSELKGALAKVDKHYTRWAETIQQAARGKGGAEGSWGGSKPQSILDQADAILRGGK